VRDYRAASRAAAAVPDPGIEGREAAAKHTPLRLATTSPFNVKVTSLRIADFTADQVRDLYGQHTSDAGQPFTAEAVARAWEYTAGQPWLVNELARVVVDDVRVPAPEPVTGEHIDQAKEARASV
jgi:hypothetical protein